MSWCEVTLHGSRELQRKRADKLYKDAMDNRYKDAEKYLLYLNIACQIYDQLDNYSEEVLTEDLQKAVDKYILRNELPINVQVMREAVAPSIHGNNLEWRDVMEELRSKYVIKRHSGVLTLVEEL